MQNRGTYFAFFCKYKIHPQAKTAWISYYLKLIYFGGIDTKMIALDVLDTAVLASFAAKILAYGKAKSKNSDATLL